ncbi:hypothetical protein ACFMQL_00885 [Nonomuraea fastidiosa]|uniref:hypothetical protein n=1 Tax=Nonomuraea TaxID=83681 RepID=UPI00324BCF0E
MVTEVAQKSGYATTFKVVAALNALVVLLQAVTAGQLMSGGAGDLHGLGSFAVHLLGLALLVAGVLLWRPGRGAGWPAVASAAVLLLGFVQSAAGGSGAMALHVPLAMTLFGLSIWLVVWSWRR